jgi:hypothetical protein
MPIPQYGAKHIRSLQSSVFLFIKKQLQYNYRMNMSIDISKGCAIIWEERKDSLKTLECVFLFNKFVLDYFAARRPIAADKI